MLGTLWDWITDFFDDAAESLGELNLTALVIASVPVIALAWFFFKDPFGAGWDKLPLMWRIATLVLGLPTFYLVASRKLNE